MTKDVLLLAIVIIIKPLAPVVDIEQILALANEIGIEVSIDIAFRTTNSSLQVGYLFDHASNKSKATEEDTSKARRSNAIRNAHAHKPANQASNQTLELFICCTQLSVEPKHC